MITALASLRRRVAVATLFAQHPASHARTIGRLSSLLVPIVGVVAAWIQLGERPSRRRAAGWS